MNKNNIVIEYAPFRVKEGVDDATLIASSDAVQAGFLSQQPGFIKRNLVKTYDGQWADIAYWNSKQEAEIAMQKAAESPICFKFFELMSVNHGAGDGVLILEVLKTYE